MPFTQEELDEIINKIWEKYDKNDDKLLNVEEAKEMISTVFAEGGNTLDDDQIKNLFENLDLNKDGVINKEELENLLRKYADE